MNYEFSAAQDDAALEIKVNQSKFDAASITEFKESLDSAWSDKIRSVAIDLSSVQFIDSSGVGALLSVQKKLPSDSSPVTLVNAKPNVVSVIELLRLHRVFNLQSQ